MYDGITVYKVYFVASIVFNSERVILAVDNGLVELFGLFVAHANTKWFK